MKKVVRRLQQEAGSRAGELEAGLQTTSGTDGIGSRSGEGDTCKE